MPSLHLHCFLHRESNILQAEARNASSSDLFVARVQTCGPGTMDQIHLCDTWVQKEATRWED